MGNVLPPGAPVAGWPGALLVMAYGLAVLTADGITRRGPELVSPAAPPYDGVLLVNDHRTGRAGVLPLDLTGPARDLGPATRILGCTADRLVFLEERTPEEPLADPYDVADEWEYQQRLAGSYGGRNVVRAVSLDSGAVVRPEVHREDLRDPHDWTALCVLRDGRLVLTRRPPGTLAGTEQALLNGDGRREPYGCRTRLLGTPGASVLVTDVPGPPAAVLVDPVAPPGAAWRARAPDGWRVFGALTLLLPGGAVLCHLDATGPSGGRCLAVAEPGGDLVPVPGSRGAQPDQTGVAFVDGSRLVFGGLRADGAAWLATWTLGSAAPATLLPMTEQLAWSRPRLLAAYPGHPDS